MPRRIQILPDSLANQIAAGEVVERPASVVKELVENALDAAATRVDIDIRNGGKTEIRVADDGCGMSREDALLALDRHATSKIHSVDDLKSVRSFGFRGEALPSIASVARLVLETAETGGVGVRIRAQAGRVLGVEECARQAGTTVIVSNLFGNVPARAKFLKSAAVETRACAEVVTTLALANLSTAFRLASNGRTLLELAPAHDLASRVAAIWDDDVAGRLLPLALVDGAARVAGLIERPDAAGVGPRRVHLFVAGRPFRDRGLLAAAERAYRTTVPVGARPSLFLYLDPPAGAVDVNVHPTKAEVRFHARAAVEHAVERAVRDALGTLESAATLDRHPTLPQLRAPSRPEPRATGVAAGNDADQFALFVTARLEPVTDGEGSAAAARGAHETGAADGGPADAAPDGPEPTLWQVHDTYILVESRAGVLIIDQHAAHERILFERLMRRLDDGGAETQRLLFPLTLRLAPAEYAVIDEMRPLFAAAGFELEPFGGRTVIVHGVPVAHRYFDAERCLRDMVAELAAGSELTRAARNQHERIGMTFACKAAIKAGQRLSRPEMLELFRDLFATELPYHDVHGRPTVVRLSLQELERRFGRHG